MRFCLVCNGLKSLNLTCPHCQSETDDLGRLSDYAGPYSPYREIESQQLDNKRVDGADQKCIHLAYCHQCQQEMLVSVDEQPMPFGFPVPDDG